MTTNEILKPLSLDQRADLVNDMRDWVKDCQWADLTNEDIDSLTDDELIKGINANYSGGLKQFISDNTPVYK
jgi:hypothetical protein